MSREEKLIDLRAGLQRRILAWSAALNGMPLRNNTASFRYEFIIGAIMNPLQDITAQRFLPREQIDEPWPSFEELNFLARSLGFPSLWRGLVKELDHLDTPPGEGNANEPSGPGFLEFYDASRREYFAIERNPDSVIAGFNRVLDGLCDMPKQEADNSRERRPRVAPEGTRKSARAGWMLYSDAVARICAEVPDWEKGRAQSELSKACKADKVRSTGERQNRQVSRDDIMAFIRVSNSRIAQRVDAKLNAKRGKPAPPAPKEEF